MIVHALDPGPERTGWALFDAASQRVLDCGVADNHDVLRWVQAGQGEDLLAIEMMQANYAATIGVSTLLTLVWVGRYQQAWRSPEDVLLISRQAVKQAVCGNVKANDAGVRQALIDRIGPRGSKRAPGPTYGVASHAWSALAVAVAAQQQRRAT